MRFIKTAYRSIQARFAAFMWAHADEAFVQSCIDDCVELIDTDTLATQISERVVSDMDIESIEREARDLLVENTDIDTSDVSEAIAENMDMREIASDVCEQVQEYISVREVTKTIVETVGDEVKDDCIERIMEEIEAQRDGWAELLVQRLLKSDEFITALALQLLRSHKEKCDAAS